MNGTDATTQSGIGRLGKRIVSSFSWRRKAYVAAPSSAGVAYLRRSACAPVGELRPALGRIARAKIARYAARDERRRIARGAAHIDRSA